MKKRISILLAVTLLIAACGPKKPVDPNPTLTPEQRWAIAKTGAQVAAQGLALRISELEKDTVENAERLRLVKIIKGFLDEFNAQVVEVTAVDFSNRETIRRAVDKALNAADNLTANDVLQLNDPKVQADIKGVIAMVRSALETIRAFLPPQ
jgi:hypothetical protein